MKFFKCLLLSIASAQYLLVGCEVSHSEDSSLEDPEQTKWESHATVFTESDYPLTPSWDEPYLPEYKYDIRESFESNENTKDWRDETEQVELGVFDEDGDQLAYVFQQPNLDRVHLQQDHPAIKDEILSKINNEQYGAGNYYETQGSNQQSNLVENNVDENMSWYLLVDQLGKSLDTILNRIPADAQIVSDIIRSMVDRTLVDIKNSSEMEFTMFLLKALANDAHAQSNLISEEDYYRPESDQSDILGVLNTLLADSTHEIHRFVSYNLDEPTNRIIYQLYRPIIAHNAHRVLASSRMQHESDATMIDEILSSLILDPLKSNMSSLVKILDSITDSTKVNIEEGEASMEERRRRKCQSGVDTTIKYCKQYANVQTCKDLANLVGAQCLKGDALASDILSIGFDRLSSVKASIDVCNRIRTLVHRTGAVAQHHHQFWQLGLSVINDCKASISTAETSSNDTQLACTITYEGITALCAYAPAESECSPFASRVKMACDDESLNHDDLLPFVRSLSKISQDGSCREIGDAVMKFGSIPLGSDPDLLRGNFGVVNDIVQACYQYQGYNQTPPYDRYRPNRQRTYSPSTSRDRQRTYNPSTTSRNRTRTRYPSTSTRYRNSSRAAPIPDNYNDNFTDENEKQSVYSNICSIQRSRTLETCLASQYRGTTSCENMAGVIYKKCLDSSKYPLEETSKEEESKTPEAYQRFLQEENENHKVHEPSSTYIEQYQYSVKFPENNIGSLLSSLPSPYQLLSPVVSSIPALSILKPALPSGPPSSSNDTLNEAISAQAIVQSVCATIKLKLNSLCQKSGSVNNCNEVTDKVQEICKARPFLYFLWDIVAVGSSIADSSSRKACLNIFDNVSRYFKVFATQPDYYSNNYYANFVDSNNYYANFVDSNNYYSHFVDQENMDPKRESREEEAGKDESRISAESMSTEQNGQISAYPTAMTSKQFEALRAACNFPSFFSQWKEISRQYTCLALEKQVFLTCTMLKGDKCPELSQESKSVCMDIITPAFFMDVARILDQSRDMQELTPLLCLLIGGTVARLVETTGSELPWLTELINECVLAA